MQRRPLRSSPSKRLGQRPGGYFGGARPWCAQGLGLPVSQPNTGTRTYGSQDSEPPYVLADTGRLRHLRRRHHTVLDSRIAPSTLARPGPPDLRPTSTSVAAAPQRPRKRGRCRPPPLPTSRPGMALPLDWHQRCGPATVTPLRAWAQLPGAPPRPPPPRPPRPRPFAARRPRPRPRPRAAAAPPPAGPPPPSTRACRPPWAWPARPAGAAGPARHGPWKVASHTSTRQYLGVVQTA